jgi:hypothetical protein
MMLMQMVMQGVRFVGQEKHRNHNEGTMHMQSVRGNYEGYIKKESIKSNE